MHKFALLLIIICSNSLACMEPEEFLFELEEFQNIPKNILSSSVKTGLWNKHKSGYAFCIFHNATLCYVLLKQKNAWEVLDTSPVHSQNLSKLGHQNINKASTYPSEWLEAAGNINRIEFTTHTWVEEQRYTTKEILVIKNGKPIYR